VFVGLPVRDLPSRFDLRLTKEDHYYTYLEMIPCQREDKPEFKRARLVLDRGTYRVRQFWWEYPNGRGITWDYEELGAGGKAVTRELILRGLPKGWVRIDVSNQPTLPTVEKPKARPSAPKAGSPPKVEY
jgi:hypothetical protein